MMILGEIIKDLRDERIYNQKEFAKMISVSQSSLSKYENDACYPSIDILVKIAELLDVSLDYLVGRSDLKCSFNKLNEQYVRGITCLKVMDDILSLTPAYRKHLVEDIKIIKFSSDFKKIEK